MGPCKCFSLLTHHLCGGKGLWGWSGMGSLTCLPGGWLSALVKGPVGSRGLSSSCGGGRLLREHSGAGKVSWGLGQELWSSTMYFVVLHWFVLPYFAMYNEQVFAPFFEGKQGCALYVGIMITHHGYKNPMYNAHKNMGAHYAQKCIIRRKVQRIVLYRNVCHHILLTK